MAEYLVNGDELTAIADAIRAKAGTTDNIKFEDFANKISQIPVNGDSGGGLTIDVQGTFTLQPGESNSIQVYDAQIDGRQFAVRLDPTNCTGVLGYYKATLDVFGRFRIEFGRLNDDYYVYPEYTNLADIWFILPRCSNEGANGFSVSLGDDGDEFMNAELLVEWGYLVTSEIDLTLQIKTVTENGTYIPDTGYDGFSKVIVNVEASGGMNVVPLKSGTIEIGTTINLADSLWGKLLAIKFKNCTDSMALESYYPELACRGCLARYDGYAINNMEFNDTWAFPFYAYVLSSGDLTLTWGDPMAAEGPNGGATIDYEIGYVE